MDGLMIDGLQMDGQMDGHSVIIIPSHYHEWGYKNCNAKEEKNMNELNDIFYVCKMKSAEDEAHYLLILTTALTLK